MSTDGDTETTEQKRARALDILQASHSFPGAYTFTVIARSRDGVTAEIRELVEVEGAPLADEHFVVTASSGGKYVSHRMVVHVADAERVLALYEQFRAIEGVIQLL